MITPNYLELSAPDLGGRRFQFLDPGGNELAIYQPD